MLSFLIPVLTRFLFNTWWQAKDWEGLLINGTGESSQGNQTKYKKLQGKKSEKKKKKQLKWIFLLLFLDKKHKEETPHHHKRLIWRWKYVGGINHVIYKEKKILKWIFLKKENSTAPQKANEIVEICWGICSVIYKMKES